MLLLGNGGVHSNDSKYFIVNFLQGTFIPNFIEIGQFRPEIWKFQTDNKGNLATTQLATTQLYISKLKWFIQELL